MSAVAASSLPEEPTDSQIAFDPATLIPHECDGGGGAAKLTLRASEVRYRRLFESAKDGILILNAKTAKITDANPYIGELLGFSHAELIGKELWEIGLFMDIEESKAAFRVLQEKNYIRYEDLPLETKAGRRADVEFVSNVYEEDGGSVIQCNIRDITERKRSEMLLAAQKDVLELAASGAAMQDILHLIVHLAQQHAGPQSRASVFLLQPDGLRLRFAATAGLSEAYIHAIDGLEVGPHSPSCGNAAFTGQTVIVSDVTKDPLWAPYLSLMMEHDIHAIWTQPLLTPSGRVLGTMALYFRTPREPEPGELDAIGLLSQTAALVIDRNREQERRKHAEIALRDSQSRLRHAADAARLTYVEVDFARGQWRTAENFAAVMGYASPPEKVADAAVGARLLLEHVVPPHRQRVAAALQDFLGGEPSGKVDYCVLGDDHIERCIESVWSAEHRPDGKLLRTFATNLDITERKGVEEHNKLLMAEVNHRAKNLLAVVLAVAQQTAKHADAAIFMERLSERISGLITSQDLLVKNSWQGVEVPELIEGQLAHFKDLIGTRVLLEGPPARLTPAAAQGIGMALHELATNAFKYGALSNSEGRVYISWHVAAQDPSFTMQWLELGGPKVAAPTRKGFGQTVIGRMAEGSVDGTVEIGYRESGFSWKMSAPAAGALEKRRVQSSGLISADRLLDASR